MRRVSLWVLHVDLDQFIAAVEVLRRPELRGKPVVVGGDGDPTKRGVVSTASYEAREYGVRSGVALRTAAKRCPDAVFLPVDADAYNAVSAEVMNVLREFDVVVEVLGWDEAFIGADVDDPESLAHEIQTRIREVTGLDCSVGIGENKLHAKIATEYGKPAGMFRLTSATWYDILGDKPTDAIWGIGKKTAKKLDELALPTVKHLAAADPHDLARRFGPKTGPWLIMMARGRSSSAVTDAPHVARSHGRETTFQRNLDDWPEIQREVAALAARVTDDVAKEGRPAVRVVVKVRFAPFITHTHGHKLAEPTADGRVIEQAALAALEEFDHDRPVRLLGVRAEFE
jgi:DNA polymerase-4